MPQYALLNDPVEGGSIESIRAQIAALEEQKQALEEQKQELEIEANKRHAKANQIASEQLKYNPCKILLIILVPLLSICLVVAWFWWLWALTLDREQTLWIMGLSLLGSIVFTILVSITHKLYERKKEALVFDIERGLPQNV